MVTASPPFVGTIDQGTTGTRFVVFDTAGTPIGDGFVSHERTLTPPNRVEYDATEIWECTRAAIQEGIDRAGVEHGELAAIGIANQRQTIVAWDADGEPIVPAQSWQDRRAESVVGELPSTDKAFIEERTGLVVDPYFFGLKLAWLLKNETYRGRPLVEAALAGDVTIGSIDSWLLEKLTGRWRTDVTNASQSLLFDQTRMQWDTAVLERLSIPKRILPPVSPSGIADVYGSTDVGGLLSEEIPVTGVIGNQQAALVGHAGFERGTTKVSYGSGNFALQNVGTEQPDQTEGLLSTVWFHVAGNEPLYGLEGPILTTGTTLEWLESLGLLPEHGRLVPTDGSECLGTQPIITPTIHGTGAPHWQSDVGGTMTRLSRFTNRQDIVRGVIDGIGFATRRILDQIAETSGLSTDVIHIDGGAMGDDGFAGRQADLLGRQLIRGKVVQTSALGAFYTAGLAIELWDGTEEISSQWQQDRKFEQSGGSAVDSRYEQWVAIADNRFLS